MIDRTDASVPEVDLGDSLHSIQSSIKKILDLVENDEVAQSTFEIVALKCEYVAEFSSLDARVNNTGCDFIKRLTRSYENAESRGLLRSGLDPS